MFVTGIAGPNNNSHAPNENLDVEYTKKFICCLAKILADTY